LNRSGPPFPILFFLKYFLASTDRRPSHREMTTPGYLFDLFFLSFIITISHTPNQTISSWEKLLNQKPRQIICSFHLIHRPPLRESGNNRKAFSHVLYLSLFFCCCCCCCCHKSWIVYQRFKSANKRWLFSEFNGKRTWIKFFLNNSFE
jgi:hypothetical protein